MRGEGKGCERDGCEVSGGSGMQGYDRGARVGR